MLKHFFSFKLVYSQCAFHGNTTVLHSKFRIVSHNKHLAGSRQLEAAGFRRIMCVPTGEDKRIAMYKEESTVDECTL
jgi:hypothetical protein